MFRHPLVAKQVLSLWINGLVRMSYIVVETKAAVQPNDKPYHVITHPYTSELVVYIISLE
jgi:hypothetical protein